MATADNAARRCIKLVWIGSIDVKARSAAPADGNHTGPAANLNAGSAVFTSEAFGHPPHATQPRTMCSQPRIRALDARRVSRE